jgi:hypothetical protein
MYVGLGQNDVSLSTLENLASNPYMLATVPIPSAPSNSATGWLNANSGTVLAAAGVGLAVILLMRLGR